MLNHLHIRNFAIVPALNLEVREGFTAITGETGAGKSILVDALGLLLGDRSDASWVRSGEDRAELAAEFSVEHNESARQWLNESELADGENCLLRRTIHVNGRSRAFINGSPVTVAQMQSLGQLLVELHGQNEHLRLKKKAEQLNLLDDSGDYGDMLDRVVQAYNEWKAVAEAVKALDQETTLSTSDLEFLNFQLSELRQHDLSVDSVTKLQNDHDRLAAGGELLEALTRSMELLEPDSPNASAGITADINAALSQLQNFTSLDPDIAEACQMLQEAAVLCEETVGSVRAARDRVDLNPSRFDEATRTLGQLHELARKHRVRMEELGDVLEALTERIELAGNADERRGVLEQKLKTRLADYRKAATGLSKERTRHAAALSIRVGELMNELGMKGGSFELPVRLNPDSPPSPRGDDEVQINISANPGMPPGPLNKIASGGELSRINLAIKVATKGGGGSATQIFDEIDAGIGGDTANAVGKLLKKLSETRLSGGGQALCVTHLAQVAVCAAHQLQVRKATGEGSTRVDTRLLSEEERIDEIARMLGGKVSDQSRAHATELLLAAGTID